MGKTIYISDKIETSTFLPKTIDNTLSFIKGFEQPYLTNKDYAKYFVSGKLNGTTKNDDNLIEKDTIALDLDQLPADTKIADIFERVTSFLECDFVIYPTFNHMKEKVSKGKTEPARPRFRIIIPLLNPISKDKKNVHDTVIDYITDILEVENDGSTKTWSQHQGLPINKKNTLTNEVGKLLDIESLYEAVKDTYDIYKLPDTLIPNIYHNFEDIPEEISDEVIYNFIETNNHKLQAGNSWLGYVMCLAMHTIKDNITLENAIKYARALGIDGSTQDGKLWADENEKALKRYINKGNRNFSIFDDTQDFWTMFQVREKYQEVMAGTQQNNSHWLNDLKKTQKEPHAIITNMENLQLILNNDENLKDLLLFNEFTEETVKGKKAPWDNRFQKYWSDTDISELRVYLSSNYGVDFGKDATHDVTLSVARRNSFHPIKDMIHSKPWDGVKRVDNVFIDYLSGDNNDYVRAVARKWLSGAVARVYRPGVKFEVVPVLEGKQGRGKSTLISKLGGDFFSDGLPDMKSKDSKEYLRGAWIVELGELSALKKTEMEQVKAFISTTVDRYRPSYGRITVNQERTCVFIGSTNEKGFLKDKTGNRRFYPIPIGYNEQAQKDVFTIEKDTVQQIWAEAYQCYMAGEELFFDEEMEEIAETYRQNATETDVLLEDIYQYLEIPIPKTWYEFNEKYNDADNKMNYIQEVMHGKEVSEPTTMKRDFISIKEVMNELLGLKVSDSRGRREQKPIQLILDNHPDWTSKNNYHPITGARARGYYRKSYLESK